MWYLYELKPNTVLGHKTPQQPAKPTLNEIQGLWIRSPGPPHRPRLNLKLLKVTSRAASGSRESCCRAKSELN